MSEAIETNETKKRWPLVVVLILICAAIAVIPLMTINDSEFGGADGAAEELVTEINPEYEAWAEPIIELPGGETESLLFCLQAAIGGCILGYGFGFYYARSKFKTSVPDAA